MPEAPSLRLLPGNCLESMVELALAGETFDSIVTDPPYHLTSVVERFGKAGSAPAQFGTDGAFARSSRGFMGKEWDGGDIAFRPETWRLAYDVLKPGSFLVAFASTRGYHRMVCAIEDAGFVIHPMLGWLFGTGFPKATRFKDMPELDGWRYGLQALKPALEPICLAQRPLDGTGPENWRKYGVGGLNIDACRIEAEKPTGWGGARGGSDDPSQSQGRNYRLGAGEARPVEGRWPANVLHDGSEEVEAAFAAFGEKKAGVAVKRNLDGRTYNAHQEWGLKAKAGADIGFSDSGSASRFYYAAKASKADRAGSSHPTVKPLSLMRWLCTLVTPPGGHILDPFAGSGSTLQAAFECGFSATGCEREPDYQADIQRRISDAYDAALSLA